jgi:DNA (cytosine-5)-methyltransferase 1
MRFLSVCSGIEAASVAWEPLGWKASGFAEIEPFPCAVLAHHYPDVPNHGDMTLLPAKIRAGEVEAPDLLCGGTPCQAFSVAGLRQSLDDARGNLTLTFCEIADAIDSKREQPCIVFWENVPGVLNTKDNAFGCFLGALAGEDDALVAPRGRWANAGFVDGPQRAVAWRVLDAQYFGVAQRRRRVFVVASARADFDPATVLFEFEGVRRDTAPSREAWQVAAPTIAGCSNGGGANGPGRDVDSCESLQVMTFDRQAQSQWGTEEVASSVMARDYKSATDLVAQPFQQTADCLTAAYGTKWNGNASATNGSLFAAQPISYGIPGNWIGRQPENGGNSTQFMEEVAPCLTGADKHGVAQSMAVRRLTPVECERLQGFPDNYTNIPWRKQPESPDGPRYKALGNSWAVPVVRWIGGRIVRSLA